MSFHIGMRPWRMQHVKHAVAGGASRVRSFFTGKVCLEWIWVEAATLRIWRSRSTLFPLSRTGWPGLAVAAKSNRVWRPISIFGTTLITTNRQGVGVRGPVAGSRRSVWCEGSVWRDWRIHDSTTALIANCRAGSGLCDTGAVTAEVPITAISTGLIPVFRILLLVASFFLLCESLPLILGFLRKFPPLLTDNFGDIRVSQTGVLSYHRSLIVLAIENEGITGSGNLGVGLTETKLSHGLLLLLRLQLSGTR